MDVTKCKMYMKNFGEFFSNQIEYAGTVILSRTDTPKATDDKVQTAVELIRSLNENAAVITTPVEQLSGEKIPVSYTHLGYCLNTDSKNGGQPLGLKGSKADNYIIKRSTDDAVATIKCKIQRRPLYLKVNDSGEEGKLLERQYGQPGIYENGMPKVEVASREELKDIVADIDSVGEIMDHDANILSLIHI